MLILCLSYFFTTVVSQLEFCDKITAKQIKKTSAFNLNLPTPSTHVSNKYIYFSISVFTKFMKVNSEVGVCNIQSQLQYSAVKQLASDYQKVKAQVTTALMTAGESERLILFFKCQHPIHF
jgi:hypothetical protein